MAHAAAAKRLWRNISLFVALPTCIALGAVTARAVSKHNEHREHAAPTEKVLVGTYVNVRTKVRSREPRNRRRRFPPTHRASHCRPFFSWASHSRSLGAPATKRSSGTTT